MPKLFDVMRLSMDQENHVNHFLPWGLREKNSEIIIIFIFFFAVKRYWGRVSWVGLFFFEMSLEVAVNKAGESPSNSKSFLKSI